MLQYADQGTNLKILEMENYTISREIMYGQRPLLPPDRPYQHLVFYFETIFVLLIPIITLITCAFSHIMKKYKTATMIIQNKSVTFASIRHRALANKIDAAILAIPLFIFRYPLNAFVLMILIEFVIISEMEDAGGNHQANEL